VDTFQWRAKNQKNLESARYRLTIRALNIILPGMSMALLPGGDDMNLKKEIVDLAYDIELKYNIVFGIVVCSTEFRRSEKAAAMPFHRNLQKEALRI
jgi:hypothetical protein